MSVVYVKEQGSIIRKRGGRILVEKDEHPLLEIPLRQTDAVSVFGNVQVTTQALSELLDRGIPLALYTRHGRLKGHLAPETSKNVPLRMAQYKLTLDDAGCSSIVKTLVCAKIRNSAAVVDAHRSNYPNPDLERFSTSLRESAGAAADAVGSDQLLGCEGAAAAVYFRAFAIMNRSELPFPGRKKHPPPDPLNALLSLGYTIAMNELRALVEGAGLEPHLGFLHRADYGRPSLALDLFEPFRAPLIDRLTLRLVNERVLQAQDFVQRVSQPNAGSVALAPDSFRRYLEHYEQALTEPRASAPSGMRAVLQEEVEKLTRYIRDQAAFTPFQEEA